MASRVACVTCLLLLLVDAAVSRAQTVDDAPPPSGTLTELRLKDGSTLYGVVREDTTGSIVFTTVAGVVLDVPRREVASILPARGEVVAGEFRPADPSETRLIFGATARSLRRGESYLALVEFVLPFVQVGVTDRFSIGGGMPPWPFETSQAPPVWVTPKYQFYRSASTTAAAGLFNLETFGSGRLGIAYAVATTGSADRSVSIGAGWAYARYDEESYPTSCASSRRAPTGSAPSCGDERTSTTTVGSPVVMIGGERRLGARVKIVTENYAFRHGGIASIAVRLLSRRFSTDLGVFAPVGGGAVVFAPVVNFVWRFGA